MASLELKAVSKSYSGTENVIEPSSLHISDGEFLALLGPSGCGKSTLLRMIAGLEGLSDGEILIDSRPVSQLPGKARDVAMVFQDYALYPQMSAAENIAFPLRVRKTPKPEVIAQVNQIAELLGIDKVLNRLPAQMSGGQRQRVAMARALVRKPKVLLLDEPLSNLDAALRDQMRAEIRRITRETGVTTVYVTHDQVEAMTMADRVAVLNRGRIEQLAEPLELYTKPATIFVASFLGSPPMNLLAARLSDDGVIELDGGTPETVAKIRAKPLDHHALPEQIFLGLRPEHLRVGPVPQSGPQHNGGVQHDDGAYHPGGTHHPGDRADVVRWRATLLSTEAIGSETLFRADLGKARVLRVKLPGIHLLAPGSEVLVEADLDNALIYSRSGGELIPCKITC